MNRKPNGYSKLIGVLGLVLGFHIMLLHSHIHGYQLNSLTISYANLTSEWTGISSVEGTNGPPTPTKTCIVWKESQASKIKITKPAASASKGLNGVSYWNLSNHSHFQFWLNVNYPCSCNLMTVYLGSENSATTGADFFAYDLVLNFSGWKKIVLSRDQFRKSSTPLGWDKIDQFAFQTSIVNTSVIIRIGEVSIVDDINPTLTIEELFSLLDNNTSDSYFNGAVNQAILNSDYSIASQKLCDYYMNRKEWNWSFNPRDFTSYTLPTLSVRNSILNTANDFVNGKVWVNGIAGQFTNGSSINWKYNPTAVTGTYDPEWTWQLNRMDLWKTLGQAYWIAKITNQNQLADKYLMTFSNQLNLWFNSQRRPYMPNQAEYSTWRTIEAGIRLSNSWIDTFFRFLTSMKCEDVMTFMKSYYEQATYIQEFSTSGNWLTMELNGLFTAGSIFSEFKSASSWRNMAIRTLYQQIAFQFLRDGMHNELSTGYHQIAIDNIIGLYINSKTLGKYTEEFPDDYVDLLQQALEANVALMTPSGYLPLLNDAWLVNVQTYTTSYKNYFLDSLLLQWVVNRDMVKIPSFNSTFLKYSNLAVFRDGWSTSNNYAVMDMGALGANHWHQDKLNIIIEPYGRRNLLMDSGGGDYDTSVYRAYAISTESHNTVLVDGLPQVRKAVSGDYASGVGNAKTPSPVFNSVQYYDYACGWYMDTYGNISYSPAHHRREIFFAKANDKVAIPMFLFVDNMYTVDGKEHMYEARFHLNSILTKSNPSFKSLSTVDPGIPNLSIIPLSAITSVYNASGQTSPKLLGWSIARSSAPVKATTVVHSQSSKNATMISLLVPLRSGQLFDLESVNEIVPNNQFRLVGFHPSSREKISIDIKINDPSNQDGISITQTLLTNNQIVYSSKY